MLKVNTPVTSVNVISPAGPNSDSYGSLADNALIVNDAEPATFADDRGVANGIHVFADNPAPADTVKFFPETFKSEILLTCHWLKK